MTASQPLLADHLLDGVPLPEDVREAASHASKFAGAWAGVWDNRLKFILVVEAIEPSGKVKTVYATADNPGRYERYWRRLDGEIVDGALTVFGRLANVVFSFSKTGRLRGVLGDGVGFAVLQPLPLHEAIAGSVTPNWHIGERRMLKTSIVEDDGATSLEMVLFLPKGEGPFPLAVVNHGSTGRGADPKLAKETWSNIWLADVLNEHGWAAAFPQRRGRGGSDGRYDEGFSKNRSEGYSCDPTLSLAGADRALIDIEAAVEALHNLPEIDKSPILLAGNSRGGALSIAFAGLHRDHVAGVINFVGGWMGVGCPETTEINQSVLNKGAAFGRPTLWLYGRDDLFYSIDHNHKNFASYLEAGGLGRFMEVDVPGKNNGHWVMVVPTLWQDEVEDYLKGLRDGK
ncbi:MAG: acetylxylan esterase [Pseudomonadota bacterium]